MAARTRKNQKPIASTVAFVGSGRLASYLAHAVHDRGFKITEIIARDAPQARRRAKALATRVGAKVATASSASLDAAILWFLVPDGEISHAARAIANRLTELERGNSEEQGTNCQRRDARKTALRFAFHSSGALSSRDLAALRAHRVAIASLHPLMTFVAGSKPSLQKVPFALEGDAAAIRFARAIVRSLGGDSFEIRSSRKAAYHAWATMTSPLLVAFLVSLEEAAHAAGIAKEDARRKSLPIIRQTIANYARLGPAASFSGPLIRGDADTVAKHLSTFREHPGVRQVYRDLAQAALRGLPIKNKKHIQRLLRKQ